MENDGYVSLWISEETDEARLEAALADSYTEDGDWIPPEFAKAFHFARFNPSTRESSVLKSATKSIREALAGFSYDSVIAERFAKELGEELPLEAKSVALLYNFRFSGAPSTALVDGSTWIYVGCVRYEP
ncbi:MAG: immunity 22 family protein [Deltaproteobacteria bacterium]|nr:immunity 22 family protein [Kofleriaceae bacterium]